MTETSQHASFRTESLSLLQSSASAIWDDHGAPAQRPDQGFPVSTRNSGGEESSPALRRKGKSVQFNAVNDVKNIEKESRGENLDPGKPGESSSPWSTKLLLTLDGGGIRGYASLLVLQRLMEIIAEEEKRWDEHAESSADSPILDTSVQDSVKRFGYLPCNYFDFIAGTSTGGLIAIMLGRLRMSVDECLERYTSLGDQIFKPKPRRVRFGLLLGFNRTWPTEQSQAAIDQILSKPFRGIEPESFQSNLTTQEANMGLKAVSTTDSTYKDSSQSVKDATTNETFESNPFQCQTIVIAVQLTKGIVRPHVFRSYEKNPSISNLPRRDTRSFGGGEASPVPSVAEVAKAISARLFKPFEVEKVGYIDGSIYANNPTLEVFREVEATNKTGAVHIVAVMSIGTIKRRHTSHGPPWQRQKALVNALSRSTDFVHGKMEEIMKTIEGSEYCRIELPEGSEVDDPSIDDFLKSGTMEKLRHIAKLLVTKRRARANTPIWESFALGITYTCRKCPTKKLFNGRKSLLRHWIREHDYDFPDPSTIGKIEEELDLSRDIAPGTELP